MLGSLAEAAAEGNRTDGGVARVAGEGRKGSASPARVSLDPFSFGVLPVRGAPSCRRQGLLWDAGARFLLELTLSSFLS